MPSEYLFPLLGPTRRVLLPCIFPYRQFYPSLLLCHHASTEPGAQGSCHRCPSCTCWSPWLLHSLAARPPREGPCLACRPLRHPSWRPRLEAAPTLPGGCARLACRSVPPPGLEAAHAATRSWARDGQRRQEAWALGPSDRATGYYVLDGLREG